MVNTDSGFPRPSTTIRTAFVFRRILVVASIDPCESVLSLIRGPRLSQLTIHPGGAVD